MINAEINDKENQGLSYPKIMIGSGSGVIVLFSKPKVGTCIVEALYYQMGWHSDSWDMDSFKDFKGDINLSNLEEPK